MKYFTSDLHFYDDALMKICDRPFFSVEEMHGAIINNFRNKVNGNGDVYLLGDITGKNGSRGMIKDLTYFLEQMGINNPNTPFRLILGNRDAFPIQDYLDMGFVSVKEIDEVSIGNIKAMLTHDPCMVQKKNTLALCGHVHTLFEYAYNAERNTLAVNMGVEVRNYTPVSEEEVVALIRETAWNNTKTT